MTGYLAKQQQVPWITSSSQNWTGTDQDEVIDSAGGNDVVDGGAGTDSILIFADRDKTFGVIII